MTTLSHSKAKRKKVPKTKLFTVFNIYHWLSQATFSLFIKLIELTKIANIKIKPRKTSPKHLKQFRITKNNN